MNKYFNYSTHFLYLFRFNVPSKSIFLIICTIFLGTVLHSQKLFLKHFTVDDGLPSNEIYQIIEDNKGNLLIASDRGAVKYDGYRFENIVFENGNYANPVYYIYKSPAGKIFFSGLKGHLFEYNNRGLLTFKFNNKIEQLFQHSGLLIANTISERNDSVFISYNNDYNYNYKIGSCIVLPNGQVKKLSEPNGIYFNLQNNFYYRQLKDTFSQKTGKPVNIMWPDGHTTIDTVTLTWHGAYIRRLYHQKLGDYDIFCIGRKVLIYKNRKKVGEQLFSKHILTCTAIENKIYLGFENGGAQVFNLINNKLSDGERYLEGLTITCIYGDKQGGIWFSTHDNGLFYSYPTKVAYWQSEEKLSRIKKNRSGVFAAYKSGLIQQLNKGKIERQLNLPLNAPGTVSNLSFSHLDSLVVITSNGTYTKEDRNWSLKKNNYSLILSSKSGLIYAASSSSPELHILKSLDGQLLKRIMLTKRVISMYSDSKQMLWLGTWEGLFRFDGTALKNLAEENPLFSDRIIAINELPNRWIAIATLGSGLILYKDGKTYVLNQKNGLISSLINSMVVEQGAIWLGTNLGLAKVKFENEKFTTEFFGKVSGLPTIDIHEFIVHDGYIYLKWGNALSVISVAELEKRAKPSATSITAIRAKGMSYDANKPPELDYSNNDIEFEFNAINLAAAKEQSYRYKLEGYDKVWHTTSDRYVKYTNIPPGHYTFNVQAYTEYSKSDSAITSYKFSISPAIWQQWWFFVLIGFVLMSITTAVFRYRLHTVKKKNQLTIALAESQQQALIQLINPHFLFNILNTIQSAILKQDRLNAAAVISHFGKLMRMSMEMSKNKMVGLNQEIELLHKYFELELLRSPDRFTYDISVSPSITPESLKIPAMLVQPFVENAIKHGVSHLSDRKGAIQIEFSKKRSSLLCSVHDNGIGRELSNTLNRKNKSHHNSSGIEITITRLELLHRQKNSKFYYEVKDLIDENGTAMGTSVFFTIPFEIHHE